MDGHEYPEKYNTNRVNKEKYFPCIVYWHAGRGNIGMVKQPWRKSCKRKALHEPTLIMESTQHWNISFNVEINKWITLTKWNGAYFFTSNFPIINLLMKNFHYCLLFHSISDCFVSTVISEIFINLGINHESDVCFTNNSQDL